MYDGSIFEIMIFFQIIFQIIHVKWSGVVSGVENRSTTIHGDEILKTFTEDTVIQNQNPVTWLCERGTGCFQTKNTFSAKDQGFVFCVQQAAVEDTGIVIIFNKVTVQIRVLKLSASCLQNIFTDLRRTGSHHFVHKPILSASFCN